MVRQKEADSRPEEQAVKDGGGRRAFRLAGVLVILSLAGAVLDPAWLLLLPAAALLSLGSARISRTTAASHRGFGNAAAAVSVSAGALIVLALAGMAIQAVMPVEPAWLTRATTLLGWLFVGSTVALGITGFARRALPRFACFLLILSLPLGLGVEAALDRVPGFFLRGVGSMGGLASLGLSFLLIAGSRDRKLPLLAGKERE